MNNSILTGGALRSGVKGFHADSNHRPLQTKLETSCFFLPDTTDGAHWFARDRRITVAQNHALRSLAAWSMRTSGDIWKCHLPFFRRTISSSPLQAPMRHRALQSSDTIPRIFRGINISNARGIPAPRNRSTGSAYPFSLLQGSPETSVVAGAPWFGRRK